MGQSANESILINTAEKGTAVQDDSATNKSVSIYLFFDFKEFQNALLFPLQRCYMYKCQFFARIGHELFEQSAS